MKVDLSIEEIKTIISWLWTGSMEYGDNDAWKILEKLNNLLPEDKKVDLII